MHTKKMGKGCLNLSQKMEGTSACIYTTKSRRGNKKRRTKFFLFTLQSSPFLYQRCLYEPSYNYINVFPTYFKNSIDFTQLWGLKNHLPLSEHLNSPSEIIQQYKNSRDRNETSMFKVHMTWFLEKQLCQAMVLVLQEQWGLLNLFFSQIQWWWLTLAILHSHRFVNLWPSRKPKLKMPISIW